MVKAGEGKMSNESKLKSGVDWADLEKGALYIRERRLLSMIRETDFIEAIFHAWLGKKPADNEKKMLNSVLVSFAGGWSIIPPVVFSARLAATTKAPMAQCLAAGFSSSGPAHTSAIESIMKVYIEENDIEAYVHEKIKRGEKISGFGHPVLARDPRPAELRKRATELGIAGDAIGKFDKVQEILNEEKGIFANIDGINGAVLIDLGFKDPAYGPAFFLMGRSISMTAHIIEEYRNKPFDALNIVYPGFEKIEYEYRDTLEPDE